MTVDCSWCTLKVDNDGMHALMCLHTNNDEDNHMLTEEIVMEFLNSQNIVYGINDIVIQSMLEHALYEQYMCVAKGTPALRGEDGHYEYQKDTQDMKKKPVINEDGTADYKNSLNLAMIDEGELLAVYIPPTEGTSGCDIFGNIVPSPGNGKEQMPLRGKGIRHDENNINYYAEYSGHIVMDGSKIYIDKLYIVSGDLDIEVGNVRFDGDVEVTGDVRSGLEIDAKGSIFIHGHVGACKLVAGQTITIEKGVQGRGNCHISAKEDIACKFVESCTITSEGNIYAESVLNSTLIANKQVIVTAKHGNVISSEIYGMTGVIIKEAGNNAGVPTLLRAGLPREYYARAAELNKQIHEIDEKLAAFDHHLETLVKTASENPEINITETKTQIMRAKIVLTSTRKEHADELQDLNEKIAADASHSFINVTDIVHDGVRVYIGAFPYVVTEAVREVTFKVVGNEVIVCSMEDVPE